jgi:hypothetical protein
MKGISMALEFELPLKLESTANKRWHWAVKAAKAKTQRSFAQSATVNALRGGETLRALLKAVTGDKTPWKAPVQILITRIGKRKLDSDNLAISAKHVRDGIADALGIDDGDEKRVTWSYAQEVGKDYGVRVEIK